MTTTHVPTTIPISVAAERLGVHENTVRNWIDRGLLDGYLTPTGRRKLRLTSVERLEREMFGFPSPVVELTDPTPAPPQAEAPREYAQGKLP
jgi:excisionase family DNA binding protein